MMRFTLPSWAWFALGVAPVIALGVFGGAIVPAVGDAAVLVLMLASVAWALFFTRTYWRSLDETAREAQKSAWFWGATFGALAGMLVFLLPPVSSALTKWGETMLPAHSPAYGGLWVGMMYLVGAQIVGFTLLWTAWWIAKR